MSRDERLAGLLADLTEAQRRGAADVDAAAAAHPDLADELRGLWAAVQFADDLGRRPEPPTVAPPGEPDAPPRHLGDFEVLGELGRGGMGIVYKARQKSLDRVVALKVIRRGERARFQLEAKAAARLRHPNIVAVHDAGEIDGHAYLSMELVEGTTLARLIADGPLASADAARLLLPIARAVHHAHENGILHRDLKPANVLIADCRLQIADLSGQSAICNLQSAIPKVADFGLAKEVSGGPSLTQTGVILGTPSYMPPEQVSGRHGRLGPPSDVYSLGAVLYECLTGRPPFRAASNFDTLMLVLDQEPVPPRQLNPKVDRALELICLKCLQKHPDLRYHSAAALADDLERFLGGERPSVWSGNFGDVVNGLFAETHHAAVLENWGLLWMWHSLKALAQCVATALLAWAGTTSRWPYLAIWVFGLFVWCGIFWKLRRRGGPVLFVERVIAHIWGAAVFATTGVFLVEIVMDWPVLSLSPILPLLGGTVFLVKGGLLSGRFYIYAFALYASALPMAALMRVWLPGGPLLFGVVIALCFFLPGLKYYRQQTRASKSEPVPSSATS